MFKQIFLAAALALAAASIAPPAEGREPVRLDASTVKSAERSFERMARQLPKEKRHQLLAAMVLINLKGVETAADVANNPEHHSVSIGRIKDEVAGMTADEIISHAARVSSAKSVTVEES